MKVKATRLGYYDHKRRRVGDIFELRTIKGKTRDDRSKKRTQENGVIKDVVNVKEGQLAETALSPEEQFSPLWMQKLEGSSPKRKGKQADADEVDAEPSQPALDDDVI